MCKYGREKSKNFAFNCIAFFFCFSLPLSLIVYEAENNLAVKQLPKKKKKSHKKTQLNK